MLVVYIVFYSRCCSSSQQCVRISILSSKYLSSSRCFERIVPVVYNGPTARENPAEYRKAKDMLEERTTTGCIPCIIRLGGKLVRNKNLVDEETSYFVRKDPCLPPRIHKLYGLYKAIINDVNISS